MSGATYNLGPVALIPLGEGRMFDAGGTIVAVFRTRDSRIYALDPWCPHRGGPLADGLVGTDRVLCPLHGYAFDLRTGRALHHECGSVRSYPIRLTADDELIVTVRLRRAPSAAAAAADADAGVGEDADAANVLARASDGVPIGGEPIGGEPIGDEPTCDEVRGESTRRDELHVEALSAMVEADA